MCLAVPAQILELKGDLAVVDITGNRREINISLIENPELGDYVLLHAGFAIEKIDEQWAKELQELEGLG